jgi:DnaK suppressor protein
MVRIKYLALEKKSALEKKFGSYRRTEHLMVTGSMKKNCTNFWHLGCFYWDVMDSASKRSVELLEALTRERERILSRIRALREEQVQEKLTEPGDVEDEAKALADVETHAVLIQQNETKLRQISEALNRLDRDQLGFCENCGEDIPAERLAAVPFARFCTECQAEHDRLNVRSLDEGRAEFKRWNPPHEITEEINSDDQPNSDQVEQFEVINESTQEASAAKKARPRIRQKTRRSRA